MKFLIVYLPLVLAFLFFKNDWQPVNESPTPADTLTTPQENRFTKITLTTQVANPTELAIANSGKVYVAERTGNLKVYDPVSDKVRLVGTLPTNPAIENGLIGLALDRDFEKNGWIFLFYTKNSPAKKDSIEQYLSRFTLKNDSLDFTSEKVLLKVPVDYADHSAGSLTVDSKGNLYVSTGDNTPFTFYASVSDDPEKWINDSRRTSANTNDLRGKILRIHPEPDGSYTIPEGNLFPKGTPQTRPEIFVMGCRNPYRITTDPRTDDLYWGDVGPDAAEDHTQYGPKGYDEINRATEAGNYGWPLFIADNQPYPFYTKKAGVNYPATAAPSNFSPHNTGLKKLPPAQKPLIWYPYESFSAFPTLGFGARTVIAGAVYYKSPKASPDAFPEYYENTLFFADWCRNWVMTAKLNEKGNIGEIEQFLPQIHFDKPIDMAFGPDGTLYMLEYGMGESESKGSRLVKIVFAAGNRPPVAHAVSDVKAGAAPLPVKLSADTSLDLDLGDSLSYQWVVNNKVISTNATASYVFKNKGAQKVKLMIRDKAGAQDSEELTIYVGNSPPQVKIETQEEGDFYWKDINYKVSVSDKEDNKLENKKLIPPPVTTLFYVPPGSILENNTVVSAGASRGAKLFAKSDCSACHQSKGQSIGPGFDQITGKYGYETETISRLAEKIIKGGNGIWGERAMPPHPQFTKDDSKDLLEYVFSLKEDNQKSKTIPPAGSVTVSPEKGGRYIIKAQYVDKGNKKIGSMVGKDSLVLRSPKIFPVEFDQVSDVKIDGIFTNVNHGGYARLPQVNLAGVRNITYRLSPGGGGQIEIRLDSPKGKIISTAQIPFVEKDQANWYQNGVDWSKWFTEWKEVQVPVEPTIGVHDLYFVFTNEKFYYQMMNIEWMRFDK